MTDPWYAGAEQLRTQRHQQDTQAETLRQQEALRRRTEQATAEAAYQEMKRAIAEAVPLLTRFLQERGQAAQAVLGAASRDGSYICFGSESEGGGYFSVSLDKNGLQHEVGSKSGYSSSPTSRRSASVQEAVEAFAYHGAGYEKPEKVRAIVDWLTKQIDAYMP
jgi:hypothetical protein